MLQEMESLTWVQVLYKTVFALLYTNTLQKGMNLSVLFPAMGKIVASSDLIRQPVYEKENSEFKPILLYLKIYLVSYSAFGRGVG